MVSVLGNSYAAGECTFFLAGANRESSTLPIAGTYAWRRARPRWHAGWIESVVIGLSLVMLATTACGTLGGAAVGAGAGAAVGAGTGYGAGKGALIGTGVGAAAGAIYDITKK